jgi:hypothetical protein
MVVLSLWYKKGWALFIRNDPGLTSRALIISQTQQYIPIYIHFYPGHYI